MNLNKNNNKKKENNWSNKLGDLYNLRKMCQEKGYKLHPSNTNKKDNSNHSKFDNISSV